MVESAETTIPRARNSACSSPSVMAGLASTRDRSRSWCGSRTGRRWPPIRPGDRPGLAHPPHQLHGRRRADFIANGGLSDRTATLNRPHNPLAKVLGQRCCHGAPPVTPLHRGIRTTDSDQSQTALVSLCSPNWSSAGEYRSGSAASVGSTEELVALKLASGLFWTATWMIWITVDQLRRNKLGSRPAQNVHDTMPSSFRLTRWNSRHPLPTF